MQSQFIVIIFKYRFFSFTDTEKVAKLSQQILIF